MFVPKSIIEWMTTAQLDETRNLREENAALRAERDTLKHQLGITQFTLDWLRGQVNTLQMERASLMEKAYSIRVPVPELVRTAPPNPTREEFSFEDLGDEMAAKLGFMAYGDTKQ